MAVTMERIPNRLWQCLSTDVKPTNAVGGPQGVLPGDALYVTDTKAWYIYTGTTWAVSKNSAPLRTY